MKQINRVVIVIFMTFLQFSCFSKRTGNMKEISKKHKKEKIQITDADLGKKNNFTHTEIKNEMDKKYEEIDIYEFLNSPNFEFYKNLQKRRNPLKFCHHTKNKRNYAHV